MSDTPEAVVARVRELMAKADFELPIGAIKAHAEHADIELDTPIIALIAYEPSHKYAWQPLSDDQRALIVYLVNNAPALVECVEALEGIVDDDDPRVSLAKQRARWTERFDCARKALAALSRAGPGGDAP